ncbi:cytochrome c3 family protein [Ferrimonas marina]|uniref:Cytochrome c3 n=1 Tax=Ferrimonas marina TaxID=299255 RepID=A0A1M5X9J2_9GAMM|nr:cytochrome c3 family protein [Ferrimonas marina]SHH96194.1 Cytochrome c3 [Ferrimonas marina]
MKKLLTVALLALGLATTAQAVEVRGWHDGLTCQDCHDQGIKKYPSDQACLSCHNVDDLAEATAREGKDKWQNPHNNLHFGKETPCTECHGEHQPKEHLCAQCHTFDYPDHKQ